MPVFEMPLEKLKQYQGRNPKPPDFDEYWARALQDLESTKSETELVPMNGSIRQAECFDLWFRGVGGARIHAQYLRPPVDEPVPAILQFHSYSAGAGDWFEKLAWISQGFAVAALEVRGQGGQSEDLGGVKGTTLRGHIIRGLDDDPDQLLYRQIFLDVAQLAQIVMGFPEIDANRVAATGASQGGGLSIVCAALEPRVRLVAAAYPFLSDYKRTWEMDLAKDAYLELAQYFRQFDPTHAREDEVFMRLGYIDVQHLAARVQADVLMAIGLQDAICPPSTQFAAFNKIRAPKELVLYPDYGHEKLPGLSDRILDFFAPLAVGHRSGVTEHAARR